MSEEKISLNSGNDYVEGLLQSIKDQISLTDYEVEILRETNRILREPMPTIQVALEERVAQIDVCRTDLTNLLYMIEDRFEKIQYSYQSVYDPEFMRLTRAGRPSQQAIDSEIHATKESMMEWRDTIHHYEYAKNLIFNYLKSLNSTKETCLKKLKYI